MDEKGEGELSFDIGTQGISGNISYSPLNRVVFTAGASGYKHKGRVRDNINRVYRIGAGYYSPIEEKGVFLILGGYGNGYTYIRDYSGSLNLSLSSTYTGSKPDFKEGYFHKYYLRPALGIRKGNFEGYISNRFVLVDYYGMWYSYGKNEPKYSAENFGDLILEPTFVGKWGNRKLKFKLVAGFAYGSTYSQPFLPFNLNIGVNYLFGDQMGL